MTHHKVSVEQMFRMECKRTSRRGWAAEAAESNIFKSSENSNLIHPQVRIVWNSFIPFYLHLFSYSVRKWLLNRLHVYCNNIHAVKAEI